MIFEPVLSGNRPNYPKRSLYPEIQRYADPILTIVLRRGFIRTAIFRR
jgi:hypothetical protein